MKNKQLTEELKKFNQLLNYDVEKGARSLTERKHKPYLMTEEDPEEAKPNEEDNDNPDFDFGGGEDSQQQGGEAAGGEDQGGGGFDFGDAAPAGGEEQGQGAEGGFDFDGGEDQQQGGEAAGTEPETDEFGTADEFSAADDIEGADGDVEEIDVTDIVNKSNDAKTSAEKAVVAAEEGKNMIKDLMSKFDALQASMSKIDSVSHEVTSIKRDLQAQKPKEKLELRSLDSYPFNVKLTDYWNDENLKSNYEVSDGSTLGAPDAQSPDGQAKVWKLDPNDAKDFNTTDIQKSFMPESRKKKKKVLTEINRTTKIANDYTRKILHNPIAQGLGNIASIIGDLQRLDFTALKHSFVNRSGFKKLHYITVELALLMNALKENPNMEDVYNELTEYGFDINKILQYLNDSDVIEYLLNDSYGRFTMEKHDDLVVFLEDLKEKHDDIMNAFR